MCGQSKVFIEKLANLIIQKKSPNLSENGNNLDTQYNRVVWLEEKNLVKYGKALKFYTFSE